MAKIADLLAAGITVSFEFAPPKTDEAERQLDKTVAELAELDPSFISVTYGQMGTTRDRTRDAVERFNRTHSFPCMAHLTCVGHSRAEVVELLDDYRANGIENILALAGDPPADGSDPGGEFRYARELVEVVKESGDFSVGVACHPELHPRSRDRDSDRRHLAEKLALADFAITQFFFGVDDYWRMVDDLARRGCDKPVLPGIMPFISAEGLRRMAAINNTRIPADLDARLDAVADDKAEVRKIGVEVAADLAGRLRDSGAPGLHLYTMNRADSVSAVHHALGLS